MLRFACTVAILSAPAAAQVADLTVQPAQSSASAEICIDPGFGQRCDTDGSTISGPISIELDDYDAPGAISIHDFVLVLDEPLAYVMDWGPFVGGVTIDLTGVTITYASPGTPTGPVAVDQNGDFAFAAVQALVTGTGSYDGYGPLLDGLVGSGQFNLADFGVVDSAIAGNVAVAGGVVTLSGSQSFSNTGDINGIQTSIDGTATIVATGDVPSCPADFNGDGNVNTQDVLAFLNAWTASDPRADFNDDGNINTQDVLAFLNAWASGC